MRELSLFSGAGGGLLGTHLLGWRAVGYVEWDEYCQRIIAQRIEDGFLPRAPIFGDIQAFNRDGYARAYQGLVDVVSGGFPCQPFSVAGNQLGADDPRNMWPATIDTIRTVRPRFAFLENVPGLVTSGYFGTVLGDLAESGFDCRWRILSAAELGAPHKRDRLWIVAYTNSAKQPAGKHTKTTLANAQRNDTGRLCDVLADTNETRCIEQRRAEPTPAQFAAAQRRGQDVAHTDNKRFQTGDAQEWELSKSDTLCPERVRWWEAEPDVCGMANELSEGMDEC